MLLLKNAMALRAATVGTKNCSAVSNAAVLPAVSTVASQTARQGIFVWLVFVVEIELFVQMAREPRANATVNVVAVLPLESVIRPETSMWRFAYCELSAFAGITDPLGDFPAQGDAEQSFKALITS